MSLKQTMKKSILPNIGGENGFLIRSVLVMCIIGLIIVAPFSLLNFIQARWLIGFASAAVVVVCVVNIYFSYKGQYVLLLNLLGAIPALGLSVVFAIQKLGVIGTFWTYMALCTYYLLLPLKFAVKSAILLIIATAITAYFYIDVKVLMRFIVTSVGCGSFMYFCFRQIEHQRKLLNKQSNTDTLTGAFNRQSLQEKLQNAAKQQLDKQQPSSICTFDIDHFKKINDTFGHDVGDEVLKSFCRIIAQHKSKDDDLFRIGGEEFLLLLPNTNKQQALLIANEIREATCQANLIEGHQVTVSAGIAQSDNNDDWRAWMKKSDEWLYFSKNNGRNQVNALHKER